MAASGLRIDVTGLSKRFGAVLALDDLSFSVEPGVVTGFLGPNGAGKTTTLRCLLGLVAPSAGTATIDGRPYRDLEHPLATVGASLEAASFHPGRSARAHLQVMALAAGLPMSRADELLAQVALTEYGDRRVGGYSLGMRQRLALAQALLGDPPVLLLDEPANGLDPAGIAWLRSFLRALAAEGRTVLISSHVLPEVQQTVDQVVVVARGRLVRQGSLASLDSGPTAVLVRTPTPERLRDVLTSYVVTETETDGVLRVEGATTEEVGHRAHVGGVELHQLGAEPSHLEQTFLALTGEGEPS
jgi:ABC-2 type transport system ATP-binding protein